MGAFKTQGFKHFIKDIIEKVSKSKEKSKKNKRKSINHSDNREIKCSPCSKTVKLVSFEKDTYKTKSFSKILHANSLKEPIHSEETKEYYKEENNKIKKKEILTKLIKNENHKISEIPKSEIEILPTNYIKLSKNLITTYSGQTLNRTKEKISQSLSSIQTDARTPTQRNKSYNYSNQVVESRIKLPRIFNNLKFIQNENKRTMNQIYSASLGMEKIYNGVKNLEYREFLKTYGPLKKNNCFLYGSGEGKFITNERLLNEGEAISKVNHNLVYKTKGNILESLNTAQKVEFKAKNNKHKKVESLLVSMEKIKQRLCM
jgi:hypothetical protein